MYSGRDLYTNRMTATHRDCVKRTRHRGRSNYIDLYNISSTTNIEFGTQHVYTINTSYCTYNSCCSLFMYVCTKDRVCGLRLLFTPRRNINAYVLHLQRVVPGAVLQYTHASLCRNPRRRGRFRGSALVTGHASLHAYVYPSRCPGY